MSVSLVVFFRPAIDGYFLSQTRDDLMQAADNALMHMTKDVQSAVPNSIRTPNNQCFELAPSAGGGRYRAAPDTVHDATCSGAGCGTANIAMAGGRNSGAMFLAAAIAKSLASGCMPSASVK